MNSDFSDLLKLFRSCRVRYLIVGGHAVLSLSALLRALNASKVRRRRNLGVAKEAKWPDNGSLDLHERFQSAKTSAPCRCCQRSEEKRFSKCDLRTITRFAFWVSRPFLGPVF